jgi:hypothetical protein
MHAEEHLVGGGVGVADHCAPTGNGQVGRGSARLQNAWSESLILVGLRPSFSIVW